MHPKGTNSRLEQVHRRHLCKHFGLADALQYGLETPPFRPDLVNTEPEQHVLFELNSRNGPESKEEGLDIILIVSGGAPLQNKLHSMKSLLEIEV